jgi:hypothetical protein
MYRSIYAAAAMLACAAFTTLPANAVILGFDENGPRDWSFGSADVLTLSEAVPTGNQVKNLPCLICGENQPQQPTGFGYNQFGNTGNESTVSFFSTAVVPSGPGSGLAIDQIGTGYTLGTGSVFLAALAGNLSFSVGIDVNDTSTPQTLESFWMLNLTTHTVLAVFSPDPTTGTLIPDVNNGTGFPDMTLTGFNITPGEISAGDSIIFYARITGANDGPDSFFLVPQAVAVPGPIVGAGIPGLLAACGMMFGLNRFRRKRNGGDLKTA